MEKMQIEVDYTVQRSSFCSCSTCGQQQNVEIDCQCEGCEKEKSVLKKRHRKHCHWKKEDQLREKLCRHGNYNENKFIWEIECECVGCSAH